MPVKLVSLSVIAVVTAILASCGPRAPNAALSRVDDASEEPKSAWPDRPAGLEDLAPDEGSRVINAAYISALAAVPESYPRVRLAPSTLRVGHDWSHDGSPAPPCVAGETHTRDNSEARISVEATVDAYGVVTTMVLLRAASTEVLFVGDLGALGASCPQMISAARFGGYWVDLHRWSPGPGAEPTHILGSLPVFLNAFEPGAISFALETYNVLNQELYAAGFRPGPIRSDAQPSIDWVESASEATLFEWMRRARMELANYGSLDSLEQALDLSISSSP